MCAERSPAPSRSSLGSHVGKLDANDSHAMRLAGWL
jgi:hypothetical protein